MEQLKEKVSVGDTSVFKSLLYFSSTILGTRQYFRHQSDLAVSMTRWLDMQSESKKMFNLFLTFSFPDLHIPELHKLLPNSEEYYSKCLSLPMYHSLTEEEQDYVIETVQSFFS